MRTARGFTLLEIMISVCILVLILGLAIPSLSGLVADRRLRHSLNDFNALVRQALERSVAEHRNYLIVWNDRNVALRPETFAEDETPTDVAVFSLGRGDSLSLSLPSALRKDPPGEWIFWPSGNCEPAIVTFKSANGSWQENYSPLTGRGDLLSYAAR